MRNSIRKIIRRTEAVLVVVLMLLATTVFAAGQQQSLTARQDNSVQSQGNRMDPEHMLREASSISKEMQLANGENASGEPALNALDLLQEYFIGELDTGEMHDVEAIAKLKRELILLDLERQKAVLENEINQLANDRASGNSEQYEKLLAEVELLKAMLAEQQSQANTSGGNNSLPTVIEIAGSLNDLEARIFVPKFGIVAAREGSTLPNGMVVDSIAAEGVRVRSGSKRYTLSLGGGIMEFPAAPEDESSLHEFSN